MSANERPFIVGLTGGIGSGKSAASDYFAQLGIHIIDADDVAREVVEPGSPALAAIAEHFGSDVLLSSSELNRAFLRDCIFNDSEQKQWLENLLHPLIRKRIESYLQTIESPYGVLSSPLLFETGQNCLTNRTLVIDSSEALQQQRASERDNVSHEQIAAIMQSQLSREERQQKADTVITNCGSLDELHHAIEQYHQQLLNELTP